MSNDTFIFLHLPKVGGTTLNSIIYKNFDPAQSWKYCPYEHDNEIIGLQSAINSGRIKCITGHMAFGLHEYTPSFQYVTLIREPIGRVFSYYNHLKRTPATCKDKFVGIEREFDPVESMEWSVEDLLREKVSNHVSNGYTRYFAGTKGAPISLAEKEEVTSEDLKNAKSNIEKYFDVVAITEEYNKSLLLLRKYTGIRDIFYIKKNQAEKKERKKIPDATLNLVKEYNALDIELYDFAKELMLDKFDSSNLNEELVEFEKELAEFQRGYQTPRSSQIEKINHLIKTLPAGRKVALYGCGEHTQKMFAMTDIRDLKLECILDTYRGNDSYEGNRVIKADKLPEMDLDTIIISNFPFRNTIIKYLRDDLKYSGEIISFYDDKDTVPFYEY